MALIFQPNLPYPNHASANQILLVQCCDEVGAGELRDREDTRDPVSPPTAANASSVAARDVTLADRANASGVANTDAKPKHQYQHQMTASNFSSKYDSTAHDRLARPNAAGIRRLEGTGTETDGAVMTTAAAAAAVSGAVDVFPPASLVAVANSSPAAAASGASNADGSIRRQRLVAQKSRVHIRGDTRGPIPPLTADGRGHSVENKRRLQQSVTGPNKKRAR